MNTFSVEFERELLESIKNHLDKRLELEKENKDEWDLVSRNELCEKLEVSASTLDRWEKKGLKRYQSPFGRAKKIYYRKHDIFDFMAVDD